MLEVVSGEELYVIKGYLYSAHFSTLREIALLSCSLVDLLVRKKTVLKRFGFSLAFRIL